MKLKEMFSHEVEMRMSQNSGWRGKDSAQPQFSV